ncbi:MAG: hypothetical protein Q8O55_07640 [Dehalococcoidales bacterium]|nr:hypothetical protein [Dehalococcoidales bacterium]
MVDTAGRKRRVPGPGPNLAPIKDLLEAQRIHTKSKSKVAREESLSLVSRAIGSDKPLPLLRDNLDKVLDGESTLSEITIHLALVETRKK